jgi:PAS domain S-box-containing protein
MPVAENAELPPEIYQSLLENLQQALFLKDRDGVFLYVNQRFCELIDCKREAVVGKTDHDLFALELADKFRRDDLQVLSTGKPLEIIEENSVSDGAMRHFQVVKSPLLEGTEIVGVQGVFWDVSQRIQSEQKADEHRQRLNWVASVTNDTIWDCDIASDKVWWSEGIRNVWGFSEADVGASSDWWQNRIHEDDRKWVIQSVEDAKASETYSWSGEYRCRDAQGDYRHILDRAHIIRDEAGIPVRMVGSHMDISDRKRMENALVQSEERFRAFMAYNPGIAWVKDADLKHRYVNLAFEDLFGRKSAEMMGRDDNFIHPPAEAARSMNLDREVMESDHPRQVLEKTVGKTGQARHWLVTRFPFPGDDGKSWLGGVALEVSERIEAERALRAAEQRFRSFMGTSTTVAWVKDRDLKLRYVNQAFEKLFDKQADKLLGTDDFGHLPREVAESIREHDRIVLRDNQPIERVEDVPGADGKMRHWLVNKFPFVGDNNEIWVGGTAVDITQRVEAERSLRQSEGRLKLMSQASGDAVWDHNHASGQTWRNDAYTNLLGENATTGSSALAWWQERIHPDDRARVSRTLRECQGNSQAARWSDEYRFRGAGGKYLFVQEHAFIERDDGGKPIRVVGTMRDLSPIHEAQAEQQELDHKVQEAQKLESLGVLAGGIAHDFNNLLTSILGNVNLAQIDAPPSSPIQPYLGEVERSSIRAAELCKQMLAYSGRGRFVINSLNLSDLVNAMRQLLAISVSKHAVLKYHITENLPLIAADASQIRQIMMNLVTNASEAIGERSGLISIATGMMRADRDYLNSTHLSPEIPEEDYVWVEVCDTGTGMDKTTLAKIFDPFFTTKFTGRGLGLAAVQGIVRGHSGAIKVESEPLKGTRFKLLLPCIGHSAPVDTASTHRLPARTGSGMILVIDDEETVLATAARILETGGYTVALAPDGRAGLKVFKEKMDSLRMVLLDLTMPHLDGVETFQEIRKIRKDIPVVLMSGYNEQEAVQRFIGQGLAGFIQKPFQVQKFLEQIGQAVDGTTPPSAAV